MDYNFSKAINYLNRIGTFGIKPGLSRIAKLLELAGNPQNDLKFVHIAGTNGKGSISSFVSSVLAECGYKTGLFTSPHLYKINERFQINKRCIGNFEFSKIVFNLKKLNDCLEEQATKFEFLTAMAFVYFFQNNCDIVVLETGLGGRFDSTNIIFSSEVSIIGTIGLDHTEKLGNSLEKIASEKAGIIKNNSDVVLYEQEKEVYDVIKTKCNLTNSRIWKLDLSEIKILKSILEETEFRWKDFSNLKIRLTGLHQVKNACTALCALTVLKTKKWSITNEGIYSGLKNAMWPFRFEIISRSPYVIVDGAHNVQGVEVLVQNLNFYFPNKKICFVIGVLREKNYVKMFDLLACVAKCFYAVGIDNPRSLPPNIIGRHLKKYGLPIFSFSRACTGFKRCIKNSGPGDIVCAAGSLYLAKELKA